MIQAQSNVVDVRVILQKLHKCDGERRFRKFLPRLVDARQGKVIVYLPVISTHALQFRKREAVYGALKQEQPMGTLLRWQAERISFVAALNLPQKRGGRIAASEHGVTGDALRVKAHKATVMPFILIQPARIDTKAQKRSADTATHKVFYYSVVITVWLWQNKGRSFRCL